MKILVVGSGGREHTLAWKCAQSDLCDNVFVAPGNAGTAHEEKCENVDIKADDIPALLSFVKEHHIDLTIIGPEQPLVLGVVDAFEKEGLKIFGPRKSAAQLEGSKSFTKDFLKKRNIPTADYQVFNNLDSAQQYIEAHSVPIVIKADGLAAGKGVLVAQTKEDAIEFTKNCLLGNNFGEAGGSVVIEEFLQGEEASYICVVKGKSFVPMQTSQDHKLSLDGNKGQNTGGMGAYSPAPVVTKEVEDKIIEQIIKPTINGMSEDGNHFVGFLYAGLMIDKNGNPKVIEFNVRFGDPETQPVLMRLKSDFVELIVNALEGKFEDNLNWDERSSLGVVMASGGYPEGYQTGFKIEGLNNLDSETVKVFHAGTKEDGDDVVTSGGRVLCVTALGDTIGDAQKNAYEAVAKISWQDEHHRTDIGWRVFISDAE